MFTPETYMEYFSEIYRKEQEVITLLRAAREGELDARVRQSLTEELGRKARQAAWIEDALKVLTKNVEFQFKSI